MSKTQVYEFYSFLKFILTPENPYIDGKEMNIGPAPTFEKIRKKIEKRVNKIS